MTKEPMEGRVAGRAPRGASTLSDAPALGCAYKLGEHAGVPRRKQVWRTYSDGGKMTGDVLSTHDGRQSGEAPVGPVLRAGKRVGPARELASLPEPLRRLEAYSYSVEIGEALKRLTADLTLSPTPT